jgi:hypothetical protein
MVKLVAKYFMPLSILVAIIVIIAGVRFAIVRVAVDQVGVRTVIWGVTRGVVQRDYGPGWHRYIRKAETWDLFDSTVQTFNLTREARTKDGKIVSRELPIRTADDYDVTVDIVIKYQIKKGKAYKICQEIGPGNRYKGFLLSDVREVARNVLGKMREKDLYNPDEKRRRAEEAKQLLISRAVPRHVDIIDWLILDMRFDPQLERKIKNVKLAELDELLNISRERAVEQRGITQTVDATTESLAQKIQSDREGRVVKLKAGMVTKVTNILAGADKFLIQKKAEGDLYKEERRAAGELLIARAKAEGERLRRMAMTGSGGDMIVALEAARNINLADVVISTQDIDLLDIETMVNRLGAGKDPGKSLSKKEREDFFKPRRKMPKELDVPEELEKEFEEAKPVVPETLERELEEAEPVVPEELQGKIDKEWDSLTKEYPVGQ